MRAQSVYMRIAILANAFPPGSRGGAARIAEIQVDILRAAGEEVRVWQPAVPWFSKSAVLRLGHHFRDLSARREVVTEITAWQPHVLITHNLTGCGFGTPKAVQKSGARWIHMLHDVQLFEPSGQLINAEHVTAWQLFWASLRRSALGNPDLIISPTLWLVRRHRHRGLFWPNATRSVVLPNPSLSPQHRQSHPHEPLRLLYVGRVSPEKGSELITRLSRELSFPYELHIVGQGSALDSMRPALPSAHFYGELDRAGVALEMAAADVLLVPSRIEENQPTVILEAAAAGLPVIGSNRGGIPETLGRTGLICPPTDVNSWLRTVEELRNPLFFAAQVNHMEELAREHDPVIYAQRFLSLVRSKR